ncbi:MAG TPA: aminoglycoside phosphotransferase family protein [Micromonosporaceae bacterium]
MHLTIGPDLVRQLVDSQFPAWSALPLRRFEQAGSDNVIYRLGDDLAVRLPRGDWAAGQARKEHAWLPRIAPLLPLPIPSLAGLGEPDLGYPYAWSVARWLDGEPVAADRLADSTSAAEDLATFLTSLWRLPAATSFAPGPHPELQRRPLASKDEAVRAAITAVASDFDAVALTRVWERALAAPAWDREPVWCHGDFHVGNLLMRDDRISAVLDFGGLGYGDPACDLDIAYTLMTPRTRAIFRAALDLDAAAWDRGRGWALAGGVNAHAAYAATEPRVAEQTRRQLTAILAEEVSAR